MRAQLTDLSVRSFKPVPGKQLKVWDTKTPGFGIRINGGTKSWFVMYGRTRTLKVLGRYPDLPLANARRQALVLLGTRPAEGGRAPKFGDILPTYLEEHFRDKAPRYKQESERHLNAYFLPEFQKTQLGKITDGAVSRILAGIRGPSEKLHAFRVIRTMLKWCTVPPHRYIPRSPLEGYAAPGKDNKGTRILTDDELKRVWRACDQITFGAIVRLLILWGTRNGETARMERSWLTDNVVVLPGRITKNKRDHAIPVLPMAHEILGTVPFRGRYYFPGKKPDSHLNDGSWGKFKYELDEASGVHDWDYRDLRRTFRSNLARFKVPRHIAEVLINHVTGSKNELDEIYDRYDYIDEKREALAKIEAHLKGLLTTP
jgi:integrase